MHVHPERLQINKPGDMQIQRLLLGDKRYPALVIDNFYRDPDHVRQAALGLQYLTPYSGKHPGYLAQMTMPMAPILSFLYECFANFYYPSLESFLQHEQPWSFTRIENAGHRTPRPRPRTPHVDVALLAGLVFLNPPDQCRGGTSMYRHIHTQATAVIHADTMAGRTTSTSVGGNADADPDTVERMKNLGAFEPYVRWKKDGQGDDYDEYFAQIFSTRGVKDGYITDSAGGWELTELLEMKYNRLVLYPGCLLHSPYFRPEWFGDTPETCRLTQNFFFGWPKFSGVKPARAPAPH